MGDTAAVTVSINIQWWLFATLAVVVIIPGIVSAVFAGVAAINSVKGVQKTHELGQAINGRMQELIDKSHDKGMVDEQTAQRDRDAK